MLSNQDCRKMLRSDDPTCILIDKFMAQPKKSTLGNTVRQRRQRLRLSLHELALRAHTTAGAISHIEQGVRMPSAHLAARLAQALDCSVDELLAGMVPQNKEGRYIERITNSVKTFPLAIQKQVAEYCDFLRQQLTSKKPE